MENIVNFEISRLLKEKGYNKPCLLCYLEDGTIQVSSGEYGDTEEYNHNEWDNYSAPSIASVITWLYEKHGIWIHVSITRYGIFYCNILKKENTRSLDTPISWEMQVQLNDYNSPKEAYEEAIKYCLTNLIKNEF